MMELLRGCGYSLLWLRCYFRSSATVRFFSTGYVLYGYPLFDPHMMTKSLRPITVIISIRGTILFTPVNIRSSHGQSLYDLNLHVRNFKTPLRTEDYIIRNMHFGMTGYYIVHRFFIISHRQIICYLT